MADRLAQKSGSSQSNTRSLTLVQLLEKDQPYKEIIHLDDPELKIPDNDKIQRIQGSLVGLAVGDALGASVEFRPNGYLKEHPVTGMQGGGTWGLQAGQWTDDTSMALCLAASLIVKGEFDAYDQFVRYRRWYREGYMSSTGKCFDIGKSTREAITKFESRLEETRRKLIAEHIKPGSEYFDPMLERRMCDNDGLKLGTSDSAGNGPLMRLAPIPCFFFQSYDDVLKNIDVATQMTHGDPRAVDACRFYATLIWHALNGTSKEELLDKNFYQRLNRPLHKDIQEIAEGSYKKKKKGYEDGIRGKGYVVDALEAALWAFDNDDDKFDVGVLKAINLGDDTDTTAAIYGELAGAVYGINNIHPQWISQLYQGEFIKTVAKGLYIKSKKVKTELGRSNCDPESEQKCPQQGMNDTKPGSQNSGEAAETGSTQPTTPNSSLNKDERTNSTSTNDGSSDAGVASKTSSTESSAATGPQNNNNKPNSANNKPHDRPNVLPQ